MMERVRRFFTFISLLRVEPFMIILAISSYLRKTPLEVLIQDKLCRNVYHMDEEFCMNLPYMSDTEPNHEIKTRILSDAVTYNMYHTWITMTPGIIWSIFLGPWIDKYIHGRKCIFIIGSLTQAIEAGMNAWNSFDFYSDINWILVSFIPYTLSGAMVWTTAYSYVAATTPTKYRTMRMSILEVVLAIVQPLGVFFSGQLINLRPFGLGGQLHNYGLIFVISSGMAFVAFLWAVFVIDQQSDKALFQEKFRESLPILTKEELLSQENDLDDSTHPLVLLFNIKNIKEIVMTCVKKREDYIRAQIWLIIAGMFASYILWSAPGAFMFQFAEKIYHWDAEIWTEISSIGMIANSLVVIGIAPLLIKVFKLNDVILAIIGYCGTFSYLLILSTILTPLGYFISLVVHCTATLGPIGYKTHLSKIVEPSELGKVFTLMAVIDGFAPIIATAVFTLVFNKTIASTPGTCFTILAGITIIPIIIAMVIDYLHHIHVPQIFVRLDSERKNLEEPNMPSFSKDYLNNNNNCMLGYDHYNKCSCSRSNEWDDNVKNKNKLYPGIL